MKFPDVRQLREMHWCVPCLPFSSAARMHSAQPFRASQRRFKPSSTAIIKLAQKPLIATDSLVLKLRVISQRATCAPNVRDGNRTQREANTGFTWPCSVRTVGTVRAPTAERCRIKVDFRRRRARSRARPFEDRRDAASVVQDGFAVFSSRGAIFNWTRKCISELQAFARPLTNGDDDLCSLRFFWLGLRSGSSAPGSRCLFIGRELAFSAGSPA